MLTAPRLAGEVACLVVELLALLAAQGSHPLAGPVKPNLGSCHRRPADFGYLFYGQSLQVVEHQRHPVLVGQEVYIWRTQLVVSLRSREREGAALLTSIPSASAKSTRLRPRDC